MGIVGMLRKAPWGLAGAGGIACLGVLAASEPGREAVAAAIQDPQALLAQRSPGERGAGALLQTKVRRAPVVRQRGVPGQRVLPGVRSHPIDDPSESVVQGEPILPGEPLAVGAPGFGDVAGLPGGPGSLGSVTGPGVPVGGVVTGGGGGGSTTVPTTPTPPAAALPEAPAWVMMIVGFGAIGATLRRRGARMRLV